MEDKPVRKYPTRPTVSPPHAVPDHNKATPLKGKPVPTKDNKKDKDEDDDEDDDYYYDSDDEADQGQKAKLPPPSSHPPPHQQQHPPLSSRPADRRGSDLSSRSPVPPGRKTPLPPANHLLHPGGPAAGNKAAPPRTAPGKPQQTLQPVRPPAKQGNQPPPKKPPPAGPATKRPTMITNKDVGKKPRRNDSDDDDDSNDGDDDEEEEEEHQRRSMSHEGRPKPHRDQLFCCCENVCSYPAQIHVICSNITAIRDQIRSLQSFKEYKITHQNNLI